MSTKWLGIEGRAQSGERAAAWELPADPRAASRARALTGEALRGWRVTDPTDIDDIVLMVDELVANAIVHGSGPIRLRLHLDGPRLVAEITDDDPGAPAIPGVPSGVLDWAEDGRGLLLVSTLASDFGVRPQTPGKTVWFTRVLHTTNGRHPAAPPPAIEHL